MEKEVVENMRRVNWKFYAKPISQKKYIYSVQTRFFVFVQPKMNKSNKSRSSNSVTLMTFYIMWV